MPKPVRPFLGESAEKRIQSRRQQLIDQAFEWLADGQWRQASIAGLCRAVNLNKRYFYESFESLESLENAVVQSLTETLTRLGLEAAGQAQQQAMDTDALARHVLGACLGWLLEDPRRARVLFTKASDNPRARAQRNQVVGQLAQTLAGFGVAYHQPRKAGITPTDTQLQLAELSSSMLVGGTIESVLRWLDGEMSLSKQALIDYLTRLWVAYGNASAEIALASEE